MNVTQMIDILSTLPPEMEVVFKTSRDGEPLNFDFCDRIQITEVEMEDEPNFICAMVYEDEYFDIPDIMRFLN